jgi:hypothetical protein
VFRGDATADSFDPSAPNDEAKLRLAIRYIGRYLDGSVNVGERDLLSPTSSLARNVRWFSGDIQMLYTAFYHVSELFPAAQFHVSQLFRRVFGDASFLALIVLTNVFLLQSNAPVAPKRLAIALQVTSMIAIVGFDRFLHPIQLRWSRMTACVGAARSWRSLLVIPAVVAYQVLAGSAELLLTTLMGLANLAIHPIRIFQSWKQVARGGTLDWKASSTRAAQDMRGWPVREFAAMYSPSLQLGGGAVLLVVWLNLMGAPLTILGLNGLGVFGLVRDRGPLRLVLGTTSHGRGQQASLRPVPR